MSEAREAYSAPPEGLGERGKGEVRGKGRMGKGGESWGIALWLLGDRRPWAEPLPLHHCIHRLQKYSEWLECNRNSVTAGVQRLQSTSLDWVQNFWTQSRLVDWGFLDPRTPLPPVTTLMVWGLTGLAWKEGSSCSWAVESGMTCLYREPSQWPEYGNTCTRNTNIRICCHYNDVGALFYSNSLIFTTP